MNEASLWRLVETECPRQQFPIAARVDAAGNLRDSRGQAGELGDLAAYVRELAQLVGGELGLGRFIGLQSIDAEEQIVIGADQNGELLAVRGPRHAPATALCRLLDL